MCTYYIILYYIILYYIILYYIILYYIILYYIILYYIVLYCIILYYVMLCYVILYYTILYYIVFIIYIYIFILLKVVYSFSQWSWKLTPMMMGFKNHSFLLKGFLVFEDERSFLWCQHKDEEYHPKSNRRSGTYEIWKFKLKGCVTQVHFLQVTMRSLWSQISRPSWKVKNLPMAPRNPCRPRWTMAVAHQFKRCQRMRGHGCPAAEKTGGCRVFFCMRFFFQCESFVFFTLKLISFFLLFWICRWFRFRFKMERCFFLSLWIS